MTCIRDEVALALEGRLEPVEHLVQSLSEPLQLVTVSGGTGSRSPSVSQRSRRRAAAHRLDLPQRDPSQEIAGPGREEKSDRAGDQQLVAEARERLHVVLRA